jgi:hypothetical protein
MRPLTTTILHATGAILAFDAVGSLAARFIGFDYANLSPGSYLIYAAAGALAGWRGPLWYGPVVGGVVGAIEAGLGWPLSALLGPPEIARTYASAPLSARIGMVVLLGVLGAVLATVGAVVGVWLRKRRAAA